MSFSTLLNNRALEPIAREDGHLDGWCWNKVRRWFDDGGWADDSRWQEPCRFDAGGCITHRDLC